VLGQDHTGTVAQHSTAIILSTKDVMQKNYTQGYRRIESTVSSKQHREQGVNSTGLDSDETYRQTRKVGGVVNSSGDS